MCPWVLKLPNRWPLSCTTWQLHLLRHPQRETRRRNRPCNCVLEASGDRRCWWWQHLLKQLLEHWVDLMSPLELTWFESNSVRLNFKLRQLVAYLLWLGWEPRVCLLVLHQVVVTDWQLDAPVRPFLEMYYNEIHTIYTYYDACIKL